GGGGWGSRCVLALPPPAGIRRPAGRWAGGAARQGQRGGQRRRPKPTQRLHGTLLPCQSRLWASALARALRASTFLSVSSPPLTAAPRQPSQQRSTGLSLTVTLTGAPMSGSPSRVPVCGQYFCASARA